MATPKSEVVGKGPYTIYHLFPYDPGDGENGPRIEWDSVEVESGIADYDMAVRRRDELLEGEWRDKRLEIIETSCPTCNDTGCYECCDPSPADYE